MNLLEHCAPRRRRHHLRGRRWSTTVRWSTSPCGTGTLLPVSGGIEYAAQSAAVHGALYAESGRGRGAALTMLSDVAWSVNRLDDIADPLRIRVEQVAATSDAARYRFEVLARINPRSRASCWWCSRSRYLIGSCSITMARAPRPAPRALGSRPEGPPDTDGGDANGARRWWRACRSGQAMRRQSLSLQNIRSMRLRRL